MSITNNISMAEASNFAVSPIPSIVEFWIYAISDGLSILCSLFILYYLLFDRILRKSLNNHVIIVLLFIGLIYELTSIPWLLYRLQYGTPLIENPTFYLFSYIFDYGLYTTQIILFAWATIERHILIFHDQWLSTQKKRFLIHYLPIVVILIYCLIYYSLVTFAPFCEKSFEQFITTDFYNPCIFTETALGTWDIFGHQGVSILIIVVFSMGLLLRVLWRKKRRHQRIQWRKYRKMTIQLLSASILYLIFDSPCGIMIFLCKLGLSESATSIPLMYALFFRNYIIFLFPFVCCASLPELRRKLKKLLNWRRRHCVTTVEPIELTQTKLRRAVKKNIILE